MPDEEVERRAWFNAYVVRREQGVVRPPTAGLRYVCPCCGYLMLSGRGGYEICCLCNWEDDGQDDPRADEVWGGPNGAYSLAQARRNFLRHLIMYDPAQPSTRIGGADSPVELDAKRTMISSFDAMPSAPDEATLENLWQDVFRAEAVLESETKRKVEAYEAKHNAGGSV